MYSILVQYVSPKFWILCIIIDIFKRFIFDLIFLLLQRIFITFPETPTSSKPSSWIPAKNSSSKSDATSSPSSSKTVAFDEMAQGDFVRQGSHSPEQVPSMYSSAQTFSKVSPFFRITIEGGWVGRGVYRKSKIAVSAATLYSGLCFTDFYPLKLWRGTK